MPAVYKEKTWIAESDPKIVSIILLNTINTLGWTYKSDNPGQKVMTAWLKTQEVIRELSWQGHYELVLRWEDEKSADGASGHCIYLDLAEQLRSDSKLKCKEKAQQFLKAMKNEVIEFRKKGLPEIDHERDSNSKFATSVELNEAGYLLDRADAGRFTISQLGDKFLSLPEGESARHILVCGPTGTGKSRSIFVPNLIERAASSMIVVEATAGDEPADLYSKTAGWRASKGHKIVYFNPNDLSSDQINPLDMVQTDADARLVCELLMKATTPKTSRAEPYWDNAEKVLLTALILHVVGLREEGQCNFSHIVDLLGLSESELKSLVRNTKIAAARKRLEAFFGRGSEHTRSITMSALGQRLDFFGDARVRHLTCRTSFSAEKLLDELFTLYLAIPISRTEYRPLMGLLWQYFSNLVVLNTSKHPVSILLDEFANLGYIQGMKEKLAILRHKNISIILGFQDASQVREVYDGEAEAILSQPATCIYFKPNSLDAAEKISKMLGVTTLIEPQIRSGNVHYQKLEKTLLSPEQILNPKIDDQGKIIVKMPKGNPVRVAHIAWTAYDDYAEKYPPPARRVKQIDELLTKMSSVLENGESKMVDSPVKNDGLLEPLIEDDAAAKLAYYQKHKQQMAKELQSVESAKTFLLLIQAKQNDLMKQQEEGTLYKSELEQLEMSKLQILILEEIIKEMNSQDAPSPKTDAEYSSPWGL